MNVQTLCRDLSKIEKAIHKNIKYAECEKDKEMKKQYYRDAHDLNEIADAIRGGDHKQASRLIYDLDTLVRDQIPARLYNYVMKSF